ncbi:MAG: hypothetical protein ACYS9T_07490 [Planctomycetota bacterium]
MQEQKTEIGNKERSRKRIRRRWQNRQELANKLIHTRQVDVLLIRIRILRREIMDCVTILAQAAGTTTPPPPQEPIVPLDLFWEQITCLNHLEALTFVSFGAVCLLYGWRVFKILVVISFGLLGLGLGIMIGDKIVGQSSQIWAGIIGLALMAAISVPLMRWAVCILGAAAGGIFTSGIWYACGLTETYLWAGALIGIIAGGMISFIVFKAAVMLFSSLGGSTLIVVGLLAILHLHEQTAEQVEDLVFTDKWFLPVALLVPTAVGLIVQNKFVKGSRDWSVGPSPPLVQK